MTQAAAQLGSADLFGLFAHFMLLSLLCVGGAISAAPDMHRYIVTEHRWMVGGAAIACAWRALRP